MSQISEFLSHNEENADFNQYWYSPFTIQKIVEDLTLIEGRIAFLSTPSIFFSMPQDRMQECVVFDFDRKWESVPGFCFYDFNQPQNIPSELHQSFDCVVIDPPFITEEVWKKYSISAKLLLKPNGKILCTTVIENQNFLNDLLGVTPTAFLPSIPHLVYQYNLFTNYPSTVFSVKNPEIDF